VASRHVLRQRVRCLAQIGKAAPAFACDLRLGDGNGLDVVSGAEAASARRPRDSC